MEVYINFKSNGRRDKIILNKIKEIAPSAEYTGGISNSGHRTVFIDTGHDEVLDLKYLNQTEELDFQISIFPVWDSMTPKERLEFIRKKFSGYFADSNSKKKFDRLPVILQNAAMELDD